MTVLKNKHLILAMVIAPVLAIIAYFGTDYVVSEKPKPAAAGSSYKLAAQSNCRYQSGACTLKNGDVVLRIVADHDGRDVSLQLSSELPLDKVLIAFAEPGAESSPSLLEKTENNWQAKLRAPMSAEALMRVAVNIGNTHYYAETPAVFIDYSTGFSRDNFAGQ